MKNRSAIYTTISILVAMLLVSVVFFTYNTYTEYTDRLQLVKNEATFYSDTVYFHLRQDLRVVVADLVMITELHESECFLGENDKVCKEQLEELFAKMISIGKKYDQLRFLDLDGNEVLRVNEENHQPVVVSPGDYQNKSNRYYYSDMQTLAVDEVYFSSFDLNIENGVVEEPHLPTIRIGKKVYYNGEHIGYFLINYNAIEIIDLLSWSDELNEYHISLINDNGDYIYHSNGDNFNFMFDDLKDEGFKDEYSDIWKNIRNQMYLNNDDVLYKEVNILNDELIQGYILKPKTDETVKWHLISYIDSERKTDVFVKVITENVVVYLIIIIMVIIISILLGYLTWRNRSYQRNLKLIAERDALTGEYNRRLGLILLQENMNRCKRYNEYLAVAYIDINSLKYVNDKFGHEFGDRYIRHITETINNNKRESDILSRIGGDEFILILPNCKREGAEGLLSRMIQDLENENNREMFPFTMSFAYGVVEYSEENDLSLEDLLEESDKLMYEKKKYQKEYLRY